MTTSTSLSNSSITTSTTSTTAKTAEEEKTFASLGLVESLCESCESLGFKKPTLIQSESIPFSLKGRDVIGLAQTGSGKTAAFALPVLQALLEKPKPFFACVLSPTRELAIQISEQFEALGADIGLRSAVIVGGMDIVAQGIALSRNPHVVVATPGRLVDHLENTKGFNLNKLKFLIMDEADRLLNMDFGPEIDKILRHIPKERQTLLFSATMTDKVEKLQKASLNDPVRVEATNSKYNTVEGLVQSYIFLPSKQKELYLFWLLNELRGKTMIVFCSTCISAQRLTYISKILGLQAFSLHGKMDQSKRLMMLNKFKANESGRSILFATEVAGRGLDIPSVDVVLNYDLPPNSKDYIHRVGRTARAGRTGMSVSLVTQYDVENFQRIEQNILKGKKLSAYPVDKTAIALLGDSVFEANRLAMAQLREDEAAKTHNKNNNNNKKRRREEHLD